MNTTEELCRIVIDHPELYETVFELVTKALAEQPQPAGKKTV